jgi:hypothetical protein
MGKCNLGLCRVRSGRGIVVPGQIGTHRNEAVEMFIGGGFYERKENDMGRCADIF